MAKHVMMWHVLAGFLALAALAAHAQTDAPMSPVSSMHTVVLTAQVTVDGLPFEAWSPYYPPDQVWQVTGTGVIGTGGLGDIVLAEINGTIRDTVDLAGDPLAVMLYGGVLLDDNWVPDIPVVLVPDGESLGTLLDGNLTVTLTYGRSDYSLAGINDIVMITVDGRTFGVAVGDGAVQIIDATDPAHIVAVRSMPPGGTDAEVIPDTEYILITHGDGVYVLDMSEPYLPEVVYTMTDDSGGYERLKGASDIETVTISGRTFAVITAFEDDGVQIVDVTDPARPKPVASVTDDFDGYETLRGARGLDIVSISGHTYAAVASYNEDAVQIIDLVNPYLPLPVSAFYNDTDSGVKLDGATDVEIITDDEEVYVLVTAYNDDAIQIINITSPTVPTKIRSLTDGEGRFDTLAGATDIDVVDIGSTTYGLVTAYNDDAIQIIDLNNPALPRVVGDTLDDDDREFNLDGVRGMDAVTIQGNVYVLAAAHTGEGIQVIDLQRPALPVPVSDVSNRKDIDIASKGSWGMDTFAVDGGTYAAIAVYVDDVIQIVNVTKPWVPMPVSNVFDDAGEFEALGGATDIETVYVDGRVYGVVAAYDEDAVQIIDLTDPANPKFVHELLDGEDGFEALEGPIDVEVAVISGRTYAVVAAYDEDAIQIIDLINPDFPIPTASVHRGDVFVADEDIGREDEVRVRIMDGPRGVAVVDIADKVYCVVVGQNDDSMLILDVTNPAHPWPVSINYDRLGGIEALNGAADVEVIKVRDKVYAMVAGKWAGGMQILDITNPEDPVPVAAVFDNRDGYAALNGAADVELAPVGDRILAVVSGSFDDAVQIIDVTDPANPVPLHAAYDNSGGYDALNGADDVEVFRVSGSTYVMVASIEEESIQVARLGP